MKNAWALAAVLIASMAMWLAWTASSREKASAAPSEEVDLAPLIASIAELRKEAAELRREIESSRIEPPTREAVEPSASEAGTPGLADRVLKLERAVTELRVQNLGASNPAGAASLRQTREEAAQRRAQDLQATARNLAASETDRLMALQGLRGLRLDGADPRLAVLDEMILLAQTSTYATTRADVWRQLSHVTDARLRGPLLDALNLDKDAKVREEAAETLADFLPDAQVEIALRNAAQNDVSSDVRRQAGFSLSGR